MPVKKSKPRTVTSERRIKKYKETYRSKTVPLWFKKTLPLGANILEEWLTNQEELELQIYAELEADGIATELYPYYAALGRRCFVKCLNFSSQTYAKERTSLRNEFILRGLDSHEVDEIISIADYKCGLVKGILVTLQDIEDKLDNASWGLAAIKALIDALEGKLDDPTTGLSAIKTLIDLVEAKLDDASHGLSALKTLIDAIEAKLDDATFGLSALKTLIDALEAKLDDGTNGLAAIKTAVDAIETKLDDPTYGLAALNTDLDAIIVYVDEVESLLKNVTYGLSALNTDLDTLLTRVPAEVTQRAKSSFKVVEKYFADSVRITVTSGAANQTIKANFAISQILAGVTLDYVHIYVFSQVTENTNAAANKVNGAQNIQIQKTVGGVWTTCASILDDALRVSGSTRDVGRLLGAPVDCKSEVSANGNYNLQWTSARMDLDSMNFDDVFFLVEIGYH